jgi:hypothetical protein
MGLSLNYAPDKQKFPFSFGWRNHIQNGKKAKSDILGGNKAIYLRPFLAFLGRHKGDREHAANKSTSSTPFR